MRFSGKTFGGSQVAVTQRMQTWLRLFVVYWIEKKTFNYKSNVTTSPVPSSSSNETFSYHTFSGNLQIYRHKRRYNLNVFLMSNARRLLLWLRSHNIDREQGSICNKLCFLHNSCMHRGTTNKSRVSLEKSADWTAGRCPRQNLTEEAG